MIRNRQGENLLLSNRSFSKKDYTDCTSVHKLTAFLNNSYEQISLDCPLQPLLDFFFLTTRDSLF